MLRDIVRQFGINAKRAAPPGTIRYAALQRLSWLLPRSIRGNYDANPVAERLHRFAEASKDVFFVQVGAHEALAGDPISLYVERDGWRGILVEPVPGLFGRLQARYRRASGLAFENVAIAEQDGRRSFYHLTEAASEVYALADQLGSFDRDVILSHEEQVQDIEKEIDRLRALGMEFQSELVEQTPAIANCYGRDPDGNLIELIEYK